MNDKFVCKGIENSITFLPNGSITPCCRIKNYQKPTEQVLVDGRFLDLYTDGSVPPNCQHCVTSGPYTYQTFYNTTANDNANIQFIDFRNSNLCNLKCRVCGPHFSSAWAKELGHTEQIIKTDVSKYINQILTDSIIDIYFAGGEPIINPDHWALMEQLIELDLAKNITLRYSTNLTVLHYKDKTVFDYWSHFKKVSVMASIDATGQASDFIRSGSSWANLDNNINKLISEKTSNVDISILATVSSISVWFLPELLEYAKNKNIPVSINQLIFPDHYSVRTIPDVFVDTCISLLQQCIDISPRHTKEIEFLMNSVRDNQNKGLFTHLVASILLTDKIRGENLFDLLPFKDYSIAHILDDK